MALVSLSIGVFLIGNKDFLFSSTYRLKADFQDVGGLNNGAEVRIGGIHQGTVKEIDLPSQPDGKVTVVMNLKGGTRNIIKKDSRASIKGSWATNMFRFPSVHPRRNPLVTMRQSRARRKKTCPNRRKRSRMKLGPESSLSATTWRPSSTISSCGDFSKGAGTVTQLT
jgi:hypothetical protein